MIEATATHVPMLNSCKTELEILRARPHNVLLEGPDDATDAVLRVLWPHGRPTCALILRDVSTLMADAQEQLFAWLADEGACTQVVSTTQSPLFAFVRDGLFSASLYYRLNVLLLRVGTTERNVQLT
jgi:Sigma-54 interaction domain